MSFGINLRPGETPPGIDICENHLQKRCSLGDLCLKHHVVDVVAHRASRHKETMTGNYRDELACPLGSRCCNDECNLSHLKDVRGDQFELAIRRFVANPVLPSLEETRRDIYDYPGLQDLALLASTSSSSLVELQRFETDYPSIYRDAVRTGYKGFPLIFWALKGQNEKIVSHLLKTGTSANAASELGVPLAIFTTVNAHAKESTMSLKLLLAYGADVDDFPDGSYLPILHPTRRSTPDHRSWYDVCPARWDELFEKKLYLAGRAALEYAKGITISESDRQLLDLYSLQDLPRAGYFLVGQEIAKRRLYDAVLNHRQSSRRKAPLVLALAGPSGHGKTFLAGKLADFLGLDSFMLKMHSVNNDNDIFGATYSSGWQSLHEGTLFDQFIRAHDGKAAVVVVDEFGTEKTSAGRDAFLNIWRDGKHTSRSKHGTVHDCSGFIWIIATNAADDTIQSYVKANKESFASGDVNESQEKKLVKSIREVLRRKFNPPIINRISDFLPIVPFTFKEQQVVVSESLLVVQREVFKPVNLKKSAAEMHTAGNIDLDFIQHEAAIAASLAIDTYETTDGAVSILRGVNSIFEDALLSARRRLGAKYEEGGDVQIFRAVADEEDGVRIVYGGVA